MAKIVITGAGSAQSNGVINSLIMANDGDEIIGLGSDIFELVFCKAHKKYLVPHSAKPEYKKTLLKLLAAVKPDMIHFQHDYELFVALKFRNEIEDLGIRMLVPDCETIDTCVHKYKSWQKFKSAGIRVPENIVINNKEDLKRAYEQLADETGRIWLRSMSIGGGGKGSLPTNDFETACEWIANSDGWGDFIAAEMLTSDSITWLSIWYEGELVVAQTRKRKGWAHSALSPSGVTGVTKVGETCSDPLVDDIAMKSVLAVSRTPHGIYGVDMTYDKAGVPNPTEINISRFFTTIQFFSEAGLNMPKILKDLCLYNKFPKLPKKINPLQNGLLWLRAMDCEPRLTTMKAIEEEVIRASS
jgi:carbamoyl-phosphate synthase large subunit